MTTVVYGDDGGCSPDVPLEGNTGFPLAPFNFQEDLEPESKETKIDYSISWRGMALPKSWYYFTFYRQWPLSNPDDFSSRQMLLLDCLTHDNEGDAQLYESPRSVIRKRFIRES